MTLSQILTEEYRLPPGCEATSTIHDGIVYYRAFEPFPVDGIAYDSFDDDHVTRPIFSLEFDGGGQAAMCHSRPPTDGELDYWVRTGEDAILWGGDE